MAKNSLEGTEFSVFLEEIKTEVKGHDQAADNNKCLDICKQYLSGFWLNLGLEDIEVERLSGGISNHIYRCKAINNTGDDRKVPREVVIRLYGEEYESFNIGDLSTPLTNAIKVTMLAHADIGPKVYGVFEQGQLLKYYKNRIMTEQDLRDNSLRDQVARKLARFHYLQVPIKKQISLTTLVNDLDGFCAKYVDGKKSYFEKNNLEHLVTFDLRAECQWAYEALPTFKSPTVFGYGDCRPGNILVTDEGQTTLSDFEFAAYNYRGWDFTAFFNDFYIITDNKFEFKDESVVKQFIGSYVKQCEQIQGKEYSVNEQNSVQNIMKETKLFNMVFHLVTAKFFYGKDLVRVMSKQQSLELANNQVGNYLAVKSALVNDNILEL